MNTDRAVAKLPAAPVARHTAEYLIQRLRDALGEWQDVALQQGWHFWEEQDDDAIAAADAYLAQPEQYIDLDTVTNGLAHDLWAMAQGQAPINDVVTPMQAELLAFAQQVRGAAPPVPAVQRKLMYEGIDRDPYTGKMLCTQVWEMAAKEKA